MDLNPSSSLPLPLLTAAARAVPQFRNQPSCRYSPLLARCAQPAGQPAPLAYTLHCCLHPPLLTSLPGCPAAASHEGRMCVMGLQCDEQAAAGVEAWVVDSQDPSEDSSDVSTVASANDDCSSLLDMISAVKVLLQGLGEDITRDGLLKTPLRVAQAFQGATRGYRQAAKDIVGGALFMEPGAGTGSGGGCGGMVVVRNVELFALCESCLLPFRIRCHIAYVPVGERVVGLSKLPRVAELFAKKLQNPHRFASEVALSLTEALQPEPLGVAVLVESWHLQWPGAKENGTMADLEKCVGWVPTTAYAGTGQFAEKSSELWEELVALLQLHITTTDSMSSSEPETSSCPFTSCSCPEDSSPLPEMVEGVETLLRAIGEDPTRKELRFTSLRFVQWLLTSTQGSRAAGMELVPNCLSSRVVADTEAISTEFNFPFCSQCEHHLLPFVGVVHVAYLGRHSLDRESVQHVVRGYSLRLQVQERLTREIAEAIGSSVMVVVEASHMCMLSRGVQQVASVTSTYASLGLFATNSRLRSTFLQLVAKQTSSSSSSNSS